MEGIKRKRVTQVGSGAWSIYLPKKWIDGWSAEQMRTREVELHPLNQALLVVPVVQERKHTARVAPETHRVRRHLLSSYVRGDRDVRLEPAVGKFPSDTVSASREFLRHLDERLGATVGPDAVGFVVREAPMPTGAAESTLPAMGAKTVEILGLLRESCEAWHVDPDRALHAMRMLGDIHTDDLSRLFHQALRQVATLQVPLESVADIQLQDLLAAELWSVGERAMETVGAILAAYGLQPADLAYPRDHLAQRIGQPPLVGPFVRDSFAALRRALQESAQLLQAAVALLKSGDAPRLETLGRQARQAHQTILESTAEAMSRQPPNEEDAKHLVPALCAQAGVLHILVGLARLCETASTLLTARPAEKRE